MVKCCRDGGRDCRLSSACLHPAAACSRHPDSDLRLRRTPPHRGPDGHHDRARTAHDGYDVTANHNALGRWSHGVQARSATPAAMPISTNATAAVFAHLREATTTTGGKLRSPTENLASLPGTTVAAEAGTFTTERSTTWGDRQGLQPD